MPVLRRSVEQRAVSQSKASVLGKTSRETGPTLQGPITKSPYGYGKEGESLPLQQEEPSKTHEEHRRDRIRAEF